LVKLWGIGGGQIQEQIGQREHGGPVLRLAFSPDGLFLASGGASDGIKLWEVKTGRERGKLPTGNHTILALDFSADGRTLIVARTTGLIELWNLTDWREKVTIKGHPEIENCAAISPDGRFVARGGSDGIVRVWDITVEKAGQESIP
jgi:WD40 repeat protein